MSTAAELAMQGLRGAALDKALADQASRHIRMASLVEQLPDPENRVTLGQARELRAREAEDAIKRRLLFVDGRAFLRILTVKLQVSPAPSKQNNLSTRNSLPPTPRRTTPLKSPDSTPKNSAQPRPPPTPRWRRSV